MTRNQESGFRNEDEQPGRFKLVELPVVISVIAIAMALFLPAVQKGREELNRLRGQWSVAGQKR